ncbi:MAG TPA: septal ring lytic transglycosylase RlpA family protein [Anaeromyxobacteraceae bacterium]
MRRAARAVALAAALAVACAHPGPPPTTGARPPEERTAPPPPSVPGEPEAGEVGVASFYARSLQGRRTASGARYDGRRMTCAHRSHPFGTVLRVTDVETGKSVVVKVTDRGPFTEGRIVDLSWAAARKLGMIERGLARVRIDPVP